jgi:hypothetical protein
VSVQVLHEDRPTARKTHTCSDCGRAIRPGETYRRQDNVYDDHRYSWKTCEHCGVLVAHIYRVERGWPWDEGLELLEWVADTEPEGSPLRQHASSRWADITPDELAALLSGTPEPEKQQ